MTLKLNSSGGYTSIDAHASAANNALVLPQNNGTAGQILQTDGSGNLTWVDKPTSGITGMDQWRYTADDVAGGLDPISSNLERNDTDFEKIGTGMSVSSGIFTFPSTGIWWIQADAQFKLSSQSTNYDTIKIYGTTNNSSYGVIADALTSDGYGGVSAVVYLHATCNTIFDVTDVSTHKVKFITTMQTSSNNFLMGSSQKNMTTFTFIRLGDT